ncbi:MAG: LysR family transcriptional regulator [Ornithinimicrobium sp.]
MSLDLELAASFVVLIDEWSYHRAADELHVSRATLTKRIQRLEQQLGVRLLDRGPEGLTGLTPAGLDFARSARPLLHQVHAVQRAAQQAQDGVRPLDGLRVGVPMGSTSFLPFVGLAAVGEQVRKAFPRLRVTLVEVPYPLINRCLPENCVDLFLTIAPVKHRAVESVPLPVTATRIGVVSERHALAGAREVSVAEFCEHRLLWDPTLPEEWMSPFWLGDLRTQAEAELTTTHCSSNERVLRETTHGAAAIVTLSPDRDRLPPGLEAVTLDGAPPVRFHAAHRLKDQRPTLHLYVQQLRLEQPQLLR